MNERILSPEPATIVIFGASGDLTQRKLVPALHSLGCGGPLPQATRVLGVARTPLSDQVFRERLYEGVVGYARLKPSPGICDLWSRFAERHSYLAGRYDDPEMYRELGQRLDQLDAEFGTGGNVLFYLATPPVLYPVIVEQVGRAGLNRSDRGWRCIIIEKPFGHDLESARRLNQQVHAVFDESQIYRIDHYLGKEPDVSTTSRERDHAQRPLPLPATRRGNPPALPGQGAGRWHANSPGGYGVSLRQGLWR